MKIYYLPVIMLLMFCACTDKTKQEEPMQLAGNHENHIISEELQTMDIHTLIED